jgi:hypothetical protein
VYFDSSTFLFFGLVATFLYSVQGISIIHHLVDHCFINDELGCGDDSGGFLQLFPFSGNVIKSKSML